MTGAPASGGKTQPLRTPGPVNRYMNTSLAGASGDEIIGDREVEDEESSAVLHAVDNWYTRPTIKHETAPETYATARQC